MSEETITAGIKVEIPTELHARMHLEKIERRRGGDRCTLQDIVVDALERRYSEYQTEQNVK